MKRKNKEASAPSNKPAAKSTKPIKAAPEKPESKKQSSSVQQATEKLKKRLGKIFKKWTRQRHLPEATQQEAVVLLKRDLRHYQKSIQERNKQLNSRPVTELLRPDETTYPSKQSQSLAWIQQLQPAYIPPEQLSSAASGATSDATRSSERNSSTAGVAATIVVGDDVGSSSKSVSEKSDNQLTGILQSIVLDTGKKKYVSTSRLSAMKLIALSRSNHRHFEEIMRENTKQTLFLSQPTKNELFLWRKGTARKLSSTTVLHKVAILRQNPDEIRTFCTVCKPRHANYPFANNLAP